MYRQILVPLDGSETSLRGFEEGLKLAAGQHARLRLLNVVDDSLGVAAEYAYPAGDMGELLGALRASGKRMLDRLAARARAEGVEADTVQVDSVLRPVSAAILEEARRSNADLIVMGTHGRRGMKRVLLGSDAEAVLRESAVPILLVRAGDDPAAAEKERIHTLVAGG